MRSIASVARWATYLLVAATVLVVIVACPEGPAGEPGQPGQPGQPGEPAKIPPVVVGSIDAVDLEAGQSSDAIDVAPYFSEPEGQDLTYTVDTSAATVATASVTGSSVTITGVGAGTARITVTATDTTNLSISQPIVVTVTAVPTGPVAMMPCAATPMLKKKETCEEVVAAGQALESGDSNIFEVAVKADTGGLIWVVTAKAKGKTTLRVIDKATKDVVRTKQAEVVNTAPARSDVVLDTTENLLEMTPQTQATPSFTLDPKMDTLYTIDMRRALDKYFKDEDGAGDLTSYEITTDTPYVIVRKYDADAGLVLVDVVNKPMTADSFVISVVAVDAGEEKSPALMGTVRWQPARSKGMPYEIEQFDSGQFRAEDIELRWGSGVTHTLQFKHLVIPGDDARTGNVALEFINDKAAPDGVTYDPPAHDAVTATPPAAAALTDANGDGDIDAAAGTRWIEITATSPITPGAYTIDTDGSGPTLAFTLSGSGQTEPRVGTATITFTQYLVYDKDGTEDEHSRQKHAHGSQTLTVNIVRVK